MPAPTKVQLTGGQFQDSEGNKLALGYLLMKLAQDANISGVGNIASGIEIRIQLDSNGSVVASPAQSVWGVDQMLPPNNYYRVTGYTEKGQPAWGPNNQQVVGNGGSFDVGTWVPNQVISWTPPLQALELDTNGTLNPNQGRLNFEDSASVTWEVDGSGNLQATASATGADFEVNSTPTSDQSVLNFEDTPTVKWSNPSGGVVKATAIPAAIDSLVNNRGWKAIPNSGSFGTANGLSPQATAATNSLINPTATQVNFNEYSTNSTPGNQATISMTGATGYGITPNNGQLWSTQTLKAVKWQALLVDLSNTRCWIGLSNIYVGNVASLKSDTPSIGVIGFRYSTAAGDTNWQAVCTNGSSQTTVDTGVAADSNQHAFGISVSPTSISFTIDGALVATITTNIPANTLRFADIMSLDNAGTANAVSFAVAGFASAE